MLDSYNADNSNLFVDGKDFLKFKAIIKMLTFQFNFVLEAYLVLLSLQCLLSLLNLSLNVNVNNVSVNYDSVDKFD